MIFQDETDKKCFLIFLTIVGVPWFIFFFYSTVSSNGEGVSKRSTGEQFFDELITTGVSVREDAAEAKEEFKSVIEESQTIIPESEIASLVDTASLFENNIVPSDEGSIPLEKFNVSQKEEVVSSENSDVAPEVVGDTF